MPGFTFASTVKYIVDIELLVLRSIFSLAYCTHPWSGVARDLTHLALMVMLPPLVHLLGGLFSFFSAPTAKYTIDIELFLLHAIVAPRRSLPLV